MRKNIRYKAFIVLFVLVGIFTSSSVLADTTNAMYRLYNPNSGEHFYTANFVEAKNIINAGWKYEMVGWNAPMTGVPVYRLYNPNVGDHHYRAPLKTQIYHFWLNLPIASLLLRTLQQ